MDERIGKLSEPIGKHPNVAFFYAGRGRANVERPFARR